MIHKSGTIGYMPGLDGLRALAVFAVIAYHVDMPWASGGLLGVGLFFVLSGYLITNILLAQWERDGEIDLKDFWLRRAKRLLPALFMMLAAATLWILIFDAERLITLKNEILAATLYYSNWYLIFNHVSYFEQFGPPSPLGHLWSLAIEEQFYIIWPLLLILMLRCFSKRKWLIAGTAAIILASVLIMTLLYVPGEDPSRVYYGTDTRAFALLIGALLAIVLRGLKLPYGLSGKQMIALDGAGIISLIIVIWMVVKANQYQDFLYPGGLLLYSVATACLVAVLAHPASCSGRVFALPPLRWLGERSYGIYLWHYPVVVLTSPAVNTSGPDPVRTLLQITVSVALAAISKALIEDPIRFGRQKSHFYQRRNFNIRQKSIMRIPISLLAIALVLFITTSVIPQFPAAPVSGVNAVYADQTEPQLSEPAAQDILETPELPEPPAEPVTGELITVIGDSVMVGVEPYLRESLPGVVVDAKISRQMRVANDVISQLESDGELRKIVIIELGTNGPFTEEQLIGVLDRLEGADAIFLINARVPRHWEQAVNEMIVNVAECYPYVHSIDWYSESSGHDEYFYSDGVHLKSVGANAYCAMLIKAVNSI